MSVTDIDDTLSNLEGIAVDLIEEPITGENYTPTVPTYFGGEPTENIFGFSTGRRVCHFIIKNTRENCQRLIVYGIQSQRRGASSRGGHLVAIHNDHLHVIHGCNGSRSYCRCHLTWPQYYKCFTTASSSYDRRRLFNLWEYLVSGSERRIIFWSNSPTRSIIYKEDVYLDGTGWPEEDANLLGGRSFECDLPELATRGLEGDSTEPTQHETNCEGSTVPKKESILESIMKLADEEWIWDVSKIMGLPSVLAKYHNYVIYNYVKLSTLLQSARMVKYRIVKNWKFIDFMETLRDRNPSFGTDPHRLLDRYESTIALKDWLLHQFGDDWPNFFKRVVKKFDLECGKNASLVLVGPASSGKSWFLNAWVKLALFVGTPLNWSKGQFDFEKCVASKLLFHDEMEFPMVAPDYINTYKMLAAAHGPTVRIKFETSAKLEPTPVFGAANKHPLWNCPEQKQYFDGVRWDIYNVYAWPHCDELTTNKELNPLALFDIYQEILDMHE